jgi:hypothetical protein
MTLAEVKDGADIFEFWMKNVCQCNLTLAPAEAPCLILCPVAARRRAKR